MTRRLILASSSPYRQALLERIHVPFTCISPDIDETAAEQETPPDLVMRLAQTKAYRAAEIEPEAVIIGSDQVSVLKGKILGKPGDHDNARRQLRAMSNQHVSFFTGLCVLNAATGNTQLDFIRFEVYFRRLSESQIERYLLTEQPYQCAGSFKSEALGIALVEKMDGPDPTALIGLPLIRLCEMLANEGYKIL